MKQLANVRKAVAGIDDATLTRWVKEPGRHKSGRPPVPMPATATGTRFPSRVLPPSAMTGLLVSGHSNVKIGRDIRKGWARGYWIYTLSLEERKTCPSSCEHWQNCYGNNMPFAKRVDHTALDFLPRLEREIEQLLAVRGRQGVMIRLHALGDFYSELYVAFWGRMLQTHPRLAIYGYTARSWFDDPVGQAVYHLRLQHGERFMVRTSNGGEEFMSTVSVSAPSDVPKGSFACPEQLGKTRCCATCGLCWGTPKNVAFLDH